MRRPYRKHLVLINNKYISVKDWCRDNLQFFQQIKGIPTSEQIGTVLRSQGLTEQILKRKLFTSSISLSEDFQKKPWGSVCD
jgi:hypothetical protein